jgi:hypothetical protein
MNSMMRRGKLRRRENARHVDEIDGRQSRAAGLSRRSIHRNVREYDVLFCGALRGGVNIASLKRHHAPFQ